MTQSINPSFQANNNSNAKEIDFALVIAGWPTIYTVSKAYSLPSEAEVELSSAHGFDSMTRPWANLPDMVGAGAKARPEEGSCTIAQVNIGILDRVARGRREITDLCSRQYYVQNPNEFPRTTLHSSVGQAATLLRVDSIDGFPPQNGIAYVGLECIKYTAAIKTPDGSWLTDCTRGYRLTHAISHPSGAGVYSFLPNVYWQRALLFKGYQGLELGKWVRAFGGVLGGVERDGAHVTLSIYDSMWLAYGNNEQMIVGPPANFVSGGIFRSVRHLSPHMFGSNSQGYETTPDKITIEVDDEDPLDVIGNGHYFLDLSGYTLGIRFAEEV